MCYSSLQHIVLGFSFLYLSLIECYFLDGRQKQSCMESTQVLYLRYVGRRPTASEVNFVHRHASTDTTSPTHNGALWETDAREILLRLTFAPRECT